MTVWDHTTSKEKPRSGVGGDQRPGVKEQHPPCKNERLERVELGPIFTYYMNQINLFFKCFLKVLKVEILLRVRLRLFHVFGRV